MSQDSVVRSSKRIQNAVADVGKFRIAWENVEDWDMEFEDWESPNKQPWSLRFVEGDLTKRHLILDAQVADVVRVTHTPDITSFFWFINAKHFAIQSCADNCSWMSFAASVKRFISPGLYRDSLKHLGTLYNLMLCA